jgi:hypothetical protein
MNFQNLWNLSSGFLLGHLPIPKEKKQPEFVNKNQNAGNYNVEFNGLSLSSGIYLYKLVIMISLKLRE